MHRSTDEWGEDRCQVVVPYKHRQKVIAPVASYILLQCCSAGSLSVPSILSLKVSITGVFPAGVGAKVLVPKCPVLNSGLPFHISARSNSSGSIVFLYLLVVCISKMKA